jgi:hypothetical protein
MYGYIKTKHNSYISASHKGNIYVLTVAPHNFASLVRRVGYIVLLE